MAKMPGLGCVGLATGKKGQNGPFEWVLFLFAIITVYVRAAGEWLFARLMFVFGRVVSKNVRIRSMWWIDTGKLYAVLRHLRCRRRDSGAILPSQPNELRSGKRPFRGKPARQKFSTDASNPEIGLFSRKA